MCQERENEYKRHALSILNIERLLAGVEQLCSDFYVCVDLR